MNLPRLRKSSERREWIIGFVTRWLTVAAWFYPQYAYPQITISSGGRFSRAFYFAPFEVFDESDREPYDEPALVGFGRWCIDFEKEEA